MERIDVTKSFMPPLEEYERQVARIWDNNQLTNQGPLLREFEERVKTYLDVERFHFVHNGTIALQIALQAMDITDGEVITTPFSYVATTSSILWQRCTPVFVDIDPDSLNINPNKIEAAITKRTRAIMPVHVFGNPCDVEAIEAITKRHNLKVIYDSAHAFGVVHKGKSLLNYGDISTCSFHATKLFHTIEGGCVIAASAALDEKLELVKRFGHHGDVHYMLGINAKADEFQAAMGLCNLKYIDGIIQRRKATTELYDALLGDIVRRPTRAAQTKYNYAYYPAIFRSEEELQRVLSTLAEKNIFPRRYFYPSLNTLPYLKVRAQCPISEDIASRILCLPLYDNLKDSKVKEICEAIIACLE